jgi:D-amino-acid oxidase
MRVIVVGGGVIGLSSAINLQEAGHMVRIWARDLPPHTTSDAAAAIWYPYLASPRERVLRWADRTFDWLVELTEVTGSGVHMIDAMEVYRQAGPEPWWKESVRSFQAARDEELPLGYMRGYRFQIPLVEMPLYLPYLLRRFDDAGGRRERRDVHSLAEPLDQADVVVNCSGIGAVELAADATLYPIRGQLVRVEPIPEARCLLDFEDEVNPAYIIPRSTDCILGGTAEVQVASLRPDEVTTEEIIDRCSLLDPRLRKAVVLEVLVGLRPGRQAVRLEAEPHPDGKLVIHNYGHGGAGVTLSWGCAEEVLEIVRTVDRHE